jgi:hypothetical protein
VCVCFGRTCARLTFRPNPEDQTTLTAHTLMTPRRFTGFLRAFYGLCGHLDLVSALPQASFRIRVSVAVLLMTDSSLYDEWFVAIVPCLLVLAAGHA